MGRILKNKLSPLRVKTKGIRHELTVPHSPQQNGVAERMNRTLMESAKTMIAHAKLPNFFWAEAEAVATAAYVRNRLPTTAFKTPYEKWYERKPNVSHLKVFGCIAYAHIPDVQRQKLDKKSKKLRFVRDSQESTGYRLLNDESKKLVIRRDVIFNEMDFGLSSEETTDMFDTIEVNTQHETQGNESHDMPEDGNDYDSYQESGDNTLRRSRRHRQPPVRYGLDQYADVLVEEKVHHVAYQMCQVQEPTSMDEALRSTHAQEWKMEANSEYQALIDNNTWELVEPLK